MMLTNLNIQGLAIIDSLSIDFSQKLNVITGETGAGKSILIKALSLVLGGKLSGDIVRNGREQAVVSACFLVPVQHRVHQILLDLGLISAEEDSEDLVVVRRSVTTKGRAQAWINDIPVTQQVLRDVGYYLIDIFSQHENQRLLDPSEHIHFVDQFVTKVEVGQFSELYDRAVDELKGIRKVLDAFHERLKTKDFLIFRLEELNQFNPTSGDWMSINDLCLRAKDSLKIRSLLERLQNILDGNGGETLSRPLWEAKRLVEKERLGDSTLAEMAEEFGTVAGQIDDMSYRLGILGKGLDVDEGDIELAESRIAGYQSLFRKFSVQDVEQLVAEEERLKKELDFLDTALLDIAEKIDIFYELSTQLKSQAMQLSYLRREAVKLIKVKIEKELKELNMKGAQLDVEFKEIAHSIPDLPIEGITAPKTLKRAQEGLSILAQVGRFGAESAQILLSANPGESLKPLHKIASGGEISRIMLALKKVFAAGAETCVLVFDEIDSGISGKAADMVGHKIKELAGRFQVICISHLAQVAAYADAHFLVEKNTKQGRTESRIVRLSNEQQAEEIARLLSGSEITKPSLDNARLLVKKAHSTLSSH